VQSTSFARTEPYFAFETFFNASNIIAGFFLKNKSMFSAMLFEHICFNVYVGMIICF